MNQLPHNWELKTFGDVLSLITNGINGKQNKAALGIPVSRIETIANQSIDMSRVGYLESYDNDKINKYLLNANDILFSHINSALHLGKTALVPKGLTLYHGINLLRLSVNELVEPRYFNYYCKYFRLLGEFSANAQHSVNQSSLNQKKLKSFNIPIAPKDEQNLIAGKLDSILAKVETAKARLDKIPTILKRFRQSVLDAATTGELTKDWREKNELEEWKQVKLKDVGKGFNYGSSTKSQPEGKIPVLRMGNLQGGKLDWEKLVYTSDDVEIEKYKLQPGDVLFNRTNSPELVGKTSIYRGEREAIFAGYLIKVQGTDRLNTEFLNIQLNSPHARDYCWAVKTDGVSQSNINAKKLQAYEFQLPSIKEQIEIIRVVTELFSNADLVEKQYKAAKLRVDKMTQSILARAFSGNLFSPISEDDRETVEVKTQSTQPEHTKSDNAKVTQVDEKETSEKTDFAPESKVESSVVTENHSEHTGEVFKLLKSNNKGMSAQALFDALSDNTFSAIDVLFSELKKLIEQKVVIQAGEGENSTFKVTKK